MNRSSKRIPEHQNISLSSTSIEWQKKKIRKYPEYKFKKNNKQKM